MSMWERIYGYERLNYGRLFSSLLLSLWLGILGWRLFVEEPDQHTTIFWVDILFLFLLYGYIHITSLGLGRILARGFISLCSNTESLLLAYLLGLGALSIVIAIEGFLGWLHPLGIFIGLSLSGLVSSGEWVEIIRSGWTAIRGFHFPRAVGVYEVILRVFIFLMIPILLVHLLTPVWDYDALMYHLEIPKRFIEHGRIYFDYDMMRTAYPLLGEMLFLVGIIFRLDSLSKLIHLTYAILFVCSVYVFGKRFFSREIALTAVGILVSAPAVPFWSIWASIDFAWAGYEFWSVYAVCVWLTGEKAGARKWLILAGVMSGFAASTKYISIPALLIVAVLILWASLYRLKQTTVEIIQNLLVFGIAASSVMGAWYIKNWIVTGNPIYPLVFGGPGWEPLESMVLNDYMQTFGVGKNLLGFLTLPYFVYVDQFRFATLGLEIIHPFLWLAFLFPFFARSKNNIFISVYVFVYYVWWFFGSQVIRFLLPLSGFLALLAGDVFEGLSVRLKNEVKIIVFTGMVAFSLYFQVAIIYNSGALTYLTGQRTRANFLYAYDNGYRMKEYIQTSLKPDVRVQFLWDGRGYYCDARCVPDTEQSIAISLTINSPKPEKLAQILRDRGISYLMLSRSDAKFFIALHDPRRFHRAAQDYLDNTFLPICGRSVYIDGGMELYELTC